MTTRRQPNDAPATSRSEQADDRWNDWQANLRGIALGLEAQRKLERYGITSRGEQYTGWKALGSGREMGAGMTREEARLLLEEHSGLATAHIDLATSDELYRCAAKLHHPDVGGDAALFARITDARNVLASAAA